MEIAVLRRTRRDRGTPSPPAVTTGRSFGTRMGHVSTPVTKRPGPQFPFSQLSSPVAPHIRHRCFRAAASTAVTASFTFRRARDRRWPRNSRLGIPGRPLPPSSSIALHQRIVAPCRSIILTLVAPRRDRTILVGTIFLHAELQLARAARSLAFRTTESLGRTTQTRTIFLHAELQLARAARSLAFRTTESLGRTTQTRLSSRPHLAASTLAPLRLAPLFKRVAVQARRSPGCCKVV
ncbi:hypothetical protein FPV67DRAFT_631208 [Lyophyllum atratum]|nr:hypothetical protein FPV67DRAFT_631208 [Lyophyllum atratum]